MSALLLLLLGETPDAPIRWGVVQDGGSLVEGGWIEKAAALSGLAERAASVDDVVALLPGEQVAMRLLPSPPKGAQKLLAAATFLLEDELAEPAENLHVVVAPTGAAALAIAVNASLIARWIGIFEDAGIGLAILSADCLVAPASEARGTIIVEADRVVVRLPASAFAVDRALFSDHLETFLADAPASLSVIGENVLERTVYAQRAERGGEADDARILTLYGAALQSGAVPNFLQGRFRARRDTGAGFAPWRRAAILAAACGAVLAGTAAAEAFRADRIAQRWTEAAKGAHAAAFPDAVDDDPAAHARRVIASGAGGAAFLPLAAEIATAAEAGGNAVEVERIRFDAQRDEFFVSIRSISDAEIDALKRRLAERGVAAVDNGGYRRAGPHWVGELRVEAE